MALLDKLKKFKKKTGRTAIKAGSALRKTKKIAKRQVGEIDDFGMKPAKVEGKKPVSKKDRKRAPSVPSVDLGTSEKTNYSGFQVDLGKKKGKKKDSDFDLEVF